MKKHNLLAVLAIALLSVVVSLNAQIPTINVQPQSQTVGAGSNVTFSVVAGGGDPSLPAVSSGTLRLWLKADAGVNVNGQKVTQWLDQSGNINHASQANINLQPSFVAGAIPVSGKPVIRFDGIQSSTTGDFLQGTGNVNIPGDYTSFLVYNKANRIVEEETPLVIGIPGNIGALRSHYIRTFTINNEMAFSGWSRDVGTAFSIPTNSVRIWTDRLSGGDLGFFDTDGINSFAVTQSIGGLGAPGSGYFVGGLGNFTRNFQGDIAEVIIYQNALSDSDRISVQNYLKEKYYQSSTPGGGTLAYQWKFQGTNINGATTSSLTLSNVQPSNAGIYGLVVSNNFGGTPSSNAILTVAVPPSITAPPQKQSGLPGFDATFNVTATGTSPLHYQWFFNGITIAGATASFYSINDAQPTNAGGYSVVVTNVAGSVQSDNAPLLILTPPSIVSHPESQTVLAGTNLTLFTIAESFLPSVASGNLRLWLKADAGVIAANERVAEWRDQSVNGNHAFQPNTNKQPHFLGSSGNGKPTVRFDGIQDGNTGDWMHGSNNVNIPTGYTSFLVYLRGDRTIPEQALVGVGIPAQQGALRSHFVRNIGEMAFSGWNEDFGTGFIIPANNYRIWTDRMNDSKTLLEFFDTTATNTASFASNTDGLATPGAGYYLGGLDGFTRNFQGDISELIIFQGALTEVDRLVVQNYLKGKYFFDLSDNALSYQWQLNGTNVAGATNASLVLTNAQPVQGGNYSVILTNLAGSVTSAPALVKIRYLFPEGNGQRLTSNQYSYVESVNISFEKYFTNGMVFYTLDGSTPTFTSQTYTGPFSLTRSATIRAIIYSADFTKSGESDPVNIQVVPTYTLSAITAGGGSVVFNGLNPFPSGTVVGLTATASNGWTFLQWLGDATGTNSSTAIKMTRNKSVRAVFGTALNTSAAGGGSLSVNPAAELYPYGTIARITAVPFPGNYFGIWGSAASGNINPLYFPVITPNPTVSSLFSALNGGQFSLTVSVNGSGRATASPRANVFNSGQNVTLTAVPDAGESFLNWSGDASGTANPLIVAMNQSKSITANFTKSPRLTTPFSPSAFNLDEGFPLSLSCELGEVFNLQRSTNLFDWSTAATLTNTAGAIEYLDPPSTNTPQLFYRATQP